MNCTYQDCKAAVDLWAGPDIEMHAKCSGQMHCQRVTTEQRAEEYHAAYHLEQVRRAQGATDKTTVAQGRALRVGRSKKGTDTITPRRHK